MKYRIQILQEPNVLRGIYIEDIIAGESLALTPVFLLSPKEQGERSFHGFGFARYKQTDLKPMLFEADGIGIISIQVKNADSVTDTNGIAFELKNKLFSYIMPDLTGNGWNNFSKEEVLKEYLLPYIGHNETINFSLFAFSNLAILKNEITNQLSV